MFSNKPSKSKLSPPKLTTASEAASKISLETYLTHRAFFGLTTAKPVQRAKCRIVEGLPLGELANDPTVITMCGGIDPNTIECPSEILDLSAIRIGKSLFGAALIVWMSQQVDLSGLRTSDIVNIFVVALNLKNCKAVFKHLVQSMIEKPALRALLVDDPKEIKLKSAMQHGLAIKHPSGRSVEVVAVPLDRGGGSGVSVYSAGIVVDEYPRMIGADDGVKNIEHFSEATAGRMLPGSKILYTGSPWQPSGPAYENMVKYFGKPTEDILVLRTSAEPFRNQEGIPAWTDAKIEKLRRSKPISYQTDFLAEFADGETAVFPAQAIDDAASRTRPGLANYGRPAIFADPSALRRDYWAAMVGGWVHPATEPEDLYQTEFLGDIILPSEKRGQVVMGSRGWVRILEDDYGRPLLRIDGKAARPWFEIFEVISWNKASGARGLDLVKAVGDLGRKYECSEFHWDGYERLMLGDLVRQQGLRPIEHNWTPKNKTEAVDHLRTLFIERRIALPKPNLHQEHEPNVLLKRELQLFRQRPTPGGNFQYIVAGGAGHGDHASCLTLAMRADLDGFVDRSPTKTSTAKHVVRDFNEDPEDY